MFLQNNDLLDKLIPNFEDPSCVKIELKKPKFDAVYYELLKRSKSFVNYSVVAFRRSLGFLSREIIKN